MSINVLSLGAGVQSSTLALMAARGEIEKPELALFGDTKAEPKAVYDWLDWLEKQLPFPVVRVSKGALDEAALKLRISKKSGSTYVKHNVPTYMKRASGGRGIMPRHCTNDMKLAPMFSYLWKHYRGKQITMWIGISTDEVHRMKPSKKSYITNRFPLIDKNISRKQCLEWMEKHEYPKPPRSACVFCPYHSDDHWLNLKNESPEEFQQAVKFEVDYQKVVAQVPRLDGIPFLHNSLIPLDQVEFSTDRNKQPDLFGNECEGICGV